MRDGPLEPGSERGGAIIAVVLIGMVTSLLTITALATATSAVRASGGRAAWEQAIHLAEAGASRAIALVGADQTYSNHAAFGHDPTDAEVIAEAAAMTVESANEGQVAWIVPAGEDVAYGVGYVPARAGARSTRVARVDFRVVTGAATRAALSQGALTLSGNARITGLGGSVHANGNLSVGGTSHVDDDATATGSFTQSGTPTIGGTSGGGYPAAVLPAVTPSTYRDLTSKDLCPDGTVRATAATACTGAILGTGAVLGYEGWTFGALTGWTMGSATPSNGGFYAYHVNVRITGAAGTVASPWLATIVVEGLQAAGVMTNGDVVVSSNVNLRPWSQGVAIVASRDVQITGVSEQVEGLVMAGEQVGISGTGTLIGSVVAAGSSTTTGSPVAANSIADVLLQAEFGAPVAEGGVTVTRWTEL